MLELHLRGRVAPGQKDALIDFLAEAIPVYEEPCGIHVRLLWNTANPDDFIEVIEYADEATHDRDQQRVENDPRMRMLLTRWRALLDGVLQVEHFQSSDDPMCHPGRRGPDES